MPERFLVFIPAYNCEKQVPRVLNQLLDRQVAAMVTECIVVNNRSTDGTEAAVQSWMQAHPQAPVDVYKRQALALQALHISSEVQFITDAGFAKQHLPVQNAAKALMIRHEQRVGLMDRDWHPFEARMAPMLNAIGLHFATEGFTPAKRGHAKNFLAWGYFQGADYFKDQAETCLLYTSRCV